MRSRTLMPEVLRQLLSYAPDTGDLTWRARPLHFFNDTPGRCKEHAFANWNARWSGQPAFVHDNGHGYLRGRVLGIEVMAHRAIWAIMTGQWPTNMIDHINSNRADNRWSNLREADASQNQFNRAGWSASGHKGVYWHKEKLLWKAMFQGRHVGYFDTIEEACAAHYAATIAVAGEFANLRCGGPSNAL